MHSSTNCGCRKLCSAPLLGAAFSASPNFAVPCPSAVPSHTRTAGCGHTPRTTRAGRAGPHAPPPLAAHATTEHECRKRCPQGPRHARANWTPHAGASRFAARLERALPRRAPRLPLPPAARFPPGSFLEHFQVRDERSAATCSCRSRCQLTRGAQRAHVRTPHASSRARARAGAVAERVHHCRMQTRPG